MGDFKGIKFLKTRQLMNLKRAFALTGKYLQQPFLPQLAPRKELEVDGLGIGKHFKPVRDSGDKCGKWSLKLWFPDSKPFWTDKSSNPLLPGKIHLYPKRALTCEVHRHPSVGPEGAGDMHPD